MGIGMGAGKWKAARRAIDSNTTGADRTDRQSTQEELGS